MIPFDATCAVIEMKKYHDKFSSIFSSNKMESSIAKEVWNPEDFQASGDIPSATDPWAPSAIATGEPSEIPALDSDREANPGSKVSDFLLDLKRRVQRFSELNETVEANKTPPEIIEPHPSSPRLMADDLAAAELGLPDDVVAKVPLGMIVVEGLKDDTPPPVLFFKPSTRRLERRRY